MATIPPPKPIFSSRYVSVDLSNHKRIHQYLWPLLTVALPEVEGDCPICTHLSDFFNLVYCHSSHPSLLAIVDSFGGSGSSSENDDEFDEDTPLVFNHDHRILIQANENDDGSAIEFEIPIKKHGSEKDYAQRVISWVKKQFYLRNIIDPIYEKKLAEHRDILKKEAVERAKLKKEQEGKVAILVGAAEKMEDISPNLVAAPTATGKISIKRTSVAPTSILKGAMDNSEIDTFLPTDYQFMAFGLFQKNYSAGQQDEDENAQTRFLPLYFKMGSGKTAAFLGSVQEVDRGPDVPRDQVEYNNVVCDKTILDQWVGELLRRFPAVGHSAIYNFYGYDEFRRQLGKNPKLLFDSNTAVDEMQQYCSLKEGMIYDLEGYLTCANVVGLSGTPLPARTSDVFYLLMLNGSIPLRTMDEIYALQDLLSDQTAKIGDKRKTIADDGDTSEEAKIKKIKMRGKMTAEEEFDPLLQAEIQERGGLFTKKNGKGRYDPSIHPFEYTHNFKNPVYCRWFYKQFKDKVFYYFPDAPIDVHYDDVEVKMSWTQAFWYIYACNNHPKFGTYTICNPTRNSFDSNTRRKANCILDEQTKELKESPKYDKINELFLQAFEEQQKANPDSTFALPWVITSIYLELGIEGYERALQKFKKEHKLRSREAIITGKVDNREEIRQRFVNKEIDLLLLGPVGDRGIDLPGAGRIIFMEVGDNPGKEQQRVGRICRPANKSCKILKVKATRLIAALPDLTTPISEGDEEALIELFLERVKETRKTVCMEGLVYTSGPKKGRFSLVPSLLETIAKIRLTSDQVRVIRNKQKEEALKLPNLLLQAASVPFNEQLNRAFLTQAEEIVGASLGSSSSK